MIKGIQSASNQAIHDQLLPEITRLRKVLTEKKNLLPDKEIADMRLRYLQNSDWTQGADSPLTTEKKAEWATYRQALRDMDVDNFSGWPTMPE